MWQCDVRGDVHMTPFRTLFLADGSLPLLGPGNMGGNVQGTIKDEAEQIHIILKK